MSSIVDYEDRQTCIIFGDGAGAVLLEPTENEMGVQDSILKSNGEGRHYLHMKAGGSVKPASHVTVDSKEHFIHQEGQTVFKFAVKGMADVSAEIMDATTLLVMILLGLFHIKPIKESLTLQPIEWV